MDILVWCKKCATENTVTIRPGDRASPKCLKCSEVLMTYVAVNGYVYVLSNPRMKGLLKIGISSRPVSERMAELSAATGVPTPFQLEAYFVSDDPEGHERQIHMALAETKGKGKEFFEVPLSRALRVIESICKKSPAFSKKTTNYRHPGWKSEYDN